MYDSNRVNLRLEIGGEGTTLNGVDIRFYFMRIFEASYNTFETLLRQ